MPKVAAAKGPATSAAPALSGPVEKHWFVGIDPGKAGALSVLLGTGKALRAWHTPMVIKRHKHARLKNKQGKPKVSEKRLYAPRLMFLILHNIRKEARRAGIQVTFCIEVQAPRPEDSRHTVLAVSEAYTTWKVMLQLLSARIVLVYPHAWKPCYLPKEAPKEESRQLAIRMFPGFPLPLKKDESLAEALLIADYVRRRQYNLAFPRIRPKRVAKTKSDDPPRSKRKIKNKALSVLLR